MNAQTATPVTPRRPLNDLLSPRVRLLLDMEADEIYTAACQAIRPHNAANLLATHLRWISRYHTQYRERYFAHPRNILATAPDWPGMADDEPVETSIGRWEPGR